MRISQQNYVTLWNNANQMEQEAFLLSQDDTDYQARVFQLVEGLHAGAGAVDMFSIDCCVEGSKRFCLEDEKIACKELGKKYFSFGEGLKKKAKKKL